MNLIEIQPCQPLNAQIRPPGSKSITNRALICAALADQTSAICGALRSQDTEVMVQALNALGIRTTPDWEESRIEVVGCQGEIPNSSAELFVEGSGTSMRFLTAMCTLGNGRYRLDGIPRMRERPIEDLVKALNQLGANVKSNHGYPPVEVLGSGLQGGHAVVRADKSSQFLSGILMALPLANEFTVIQIEGQAVSLPYINLTCQVMGQFGVDVIQLPELGEYSVDNSQRYTGFEYDVEPDATAASYFWAAAAIAGGSVKVLGLNMGALQGDVRFVQILDEMGCDVESDEQGITIIGPATRGIEVDMNDISDTVQTLAAVALFVDGPTTIRGVAHNRFKETDRIGNLACELRKLGAQVEELPDGMVIQPASLGPATMETHNDHRMAMALALVGLRQNGVRIANPQCTQKTYPEFFDHLQRIAHPGG